MGLFSLALLAAGVAMWAAGLINAWMCVVWGALIFFGLAFERVFYKPIAPVRPGAGWVRTAERFVDDQSGKPVTVYLEPQTGERMYVEE